MKMKRTVATAIFLSSLISMITACSKNTESTGLNDWDDSSAASQINARLSGRYFEIPFPYSRHNCSEYFIVGGTTILDISEAAPPPGTTSLTVMVKSSTKIQANQQITAGSFAGLNCYGNPYAAGQTVNFNETFQFQKWRSGWRLQ